MKARILACFMVFSMVFSSVNGQQIPAQLQDDPALRALLLKKLPDSLRHIVENPDVFKFQMLYTRIDRNRKGGAAFSHQALGLGKVYHYPASTVKLPAAVLALEKINRLAIPGLTRETALQIEPLRPGEAPVLADSSAPNGKASIAHYIKKILLVSDNDAYNRLYEFVGQQAFNERLHNLGMPETQIVHRLEISLSEAENRATNAFRFVDEQGRQVYYQPAVTSSLTYANRQDRIGNGFMRYANGQRELIQEPLDFSQKNRWPLAYHQQLVQWIMFPETQPADNRLLLTEDDYKFLRKYMSMYPSESRLPEYANTKEYWDSYVKFLYYGSQPDAVMNPSIRIFNKVGDAYGFLIDAAYFADVDKRVEFLLSVAVYCNSDGILNDNRYDYDQLGFPLMKAIGEIIYDEEIKRHRSRKPDLAAFTFSYQPD